VNYSYKINSCGVIDCTPDWYWDTAGFDDYDVWTVFSGKGTMVIGGENFSIEEGSCFLIPPHKNICARHDPENPLLTINIHFDFLEGGKKVFPTLDVKKYIADQSFFKKLLHKAVTAHNIGRNDEAHNWLSVVLSEFSTFPSTRGNSAAQNEHAQCIRRICRKVNEHPQNTNSLATFAAEYGYSTTYLGKLFHQIAGITFSQYLLNARINQAKILLRTSDLSIAEIAETLGYYDSCHFIRQFKSAVGCSPKTYR
jgi:AraC-like DNA-binding protein